MSKKKKISNSIKDKRRLHEAEKASMKSRLGVVYGEPSIKTGTETTVKKDTPVNDKFNLPVTAIKRDMVKNGIYMLFVLLVLVVLKVSGLKF
ncbi:hypothetical protein GYA27_03380 [candidate division WWE3 bacterium]|uniref:Uncharacterized protein n=1 Tax=candidate division WWE3 bacterium TaxID=2053526 RepID=A0A7X9DL35_UNCKA|nr:hypothetical protein [candidate division WWE3 bacterium]